MNYNKNSDSKIKRVFSKLKICFKKEKGKNANLIVKDILSKRDAQYFTTKIN